MILIVNICKEPLHELEFVKPIEDILRHQGIKFQTRHYTKIKSLEEYDICGTSLQDNEFLNNIEKFSWVKDYKKPILGICGGAHIVGILLGYKKQEKKEIGMKRITLEKLFLGIQGEIEVYHLHQLQFLPEIFQKENIYATLFHPEVRNKKMILNFCNS